MVIALDTTCKTSGTGSASGVSLNHVANVLCVVACQVDTGTVSTCTVGGVSATKIGNYYQSSVADCEIWAIYRTAAANDAVGITVTAGRPCSFVAASFTGTKNDPSVVNDFEGTTTGGNTTRTVSVIITAGSSGRRIIQACAISIGSSTTATATPGGSQNDIAQIVYSSSTEGDDMNYQDSGASQTLTDTWSGSGGSSWISSVVTAILAPSITSTMDIDFVNTYEAQGGT